MVGDSMIDTYVFGHSERMSPEAPVPVVVQERAEKRLGGAANVAVNLLSLGCKVNIASITGQDENGDQFKKLMDKNGLSTDLIFTDPNRPTTEKRRIFNGTEQVVRVDIENTHPINDSLVDEILDGLESQLGSIDLLVFQDYDKGVLTKRLISKLISRCNELSIPIVVDPKERNYFHFTGATLFKPNRREFESAHQVKLDLSDIKDLEEKVSIARRELKCKILLLTLSENGLIIYDGQNLELIPPIEIDIKDVSGAGDTVVAVAALCLSANMSITEIGQITNEAGALVCEENGVVAVDGGRLMERSGDFISGLK